MKSTFLSVTSAMLVVLLPTSDMQAMQSSPLDSASVSFDQLQGMLPARHLTIVPSDVKPSDFMVSPQIEAYGNFHTMGLVATLPKEIVAAGIRTMRSFINVGGQWRPQHELVQVGDFPWFATSIFWLQPGCTYQFKVEVVDDSNQIIAVWYGEGATRADPVLQESSTSLYVATDGDDSNPGTKERPFKTVAQGFRAVQAGQTLFIREGRYYEGQLTLAHNGHPDAPIVIRSFPGEKVVLDGTDPALADLSIWESGGQGVFSADCFDGYRCGTLVRKSDGRPVRLFPVRELQHLKASAIPETGRFSELGIEGALYCGDNRIHVRAPEPLDIYHIHISGQQRGIILEDRLHVQIDGLELNHYGCNDSSCAIYVLNSSDVLIQNCNFRFDDSHIYVKLNSHRLTIQNCQFADAILEWPFDYMKGESGVSGRFEGGAVNVDAKFNGRGLVFRRNRIQSVFDGVHLTPWTVNTSPTSEIDFYENHVEGCIDDFVEADGFSRNVRIFDNFMNRSLSGVSVAQALDGPTFIIYNVIGNCGMIPAAQRSESRHAGYPFKTNGGAGAEIGSGPLFFYHNTACTLDPDSRALLVKRAKWKRMTLRNNIWVGRKHGFELWMANPSPMDFDYDNLYVERPDEPLVVEAYRTKVKTLKDVRERYGWLINGISADPMIRHLNQGDLSLSENSPCIDAGVIVFGINDLRFKGTAPDIGAFEKL